MDDDLRRGLLGIGIGLFFLVSFAVTVGHPLNQVEGLREYHDGPALLGYLAAVGIMGFGVYHLRNYRSE